MRKLSSLTHHLGNPPRPPEVLRAIVELGKPDYRTELAAYHRWRRAARASGVATREPFKMSKKERENSLARNHRYLARRKAGLVGPGVAKVGAE